MLISNNKKYNIQNTISIEVFLNKKVFLKIDLSYYYSIDKSLLQLYFMSLKLYYQSFSYYAYIIVIIFIFMLELINIQIYNF